MDVLWENIKLIWVGFFIKFADLLTNLQNALFQQELLAELYTLLSRWLLPVLAIAILLLCILPLFLNRKHHKKVWGYLYMVNGTRIPIYNWENLIGRGKYADLIINLPIVSRSHAVLTYHKHTWTIADLGSKGGIEVNGKKIEGKETVDFGDTISLAGVDLLLAAPEEDEDYRQKEAEEFNRPEGPTFILILLFQVLGAVQVLFAQRDGLLPEIPLAFLLFIAVESIHFALVRLIGRRTFTLELLCYYLCGLNLFIVASAAPHSLYKQLAAIFIGALTYTILGLILRNLNQAQKLKYLSMAVAAVLLVLNLAIGERIFGAKNWIKLGFITFQPMEFIKVAFVLAGTATLDRLLTTRNMTAFIGFAGACLVTLALIRDFGTAVVFFAAFLVMAFMHSGDLRNLLLVLSGAAFGGFAVISFMPYIATRFATWGKVWQFADTSGYQQTRTMIAIASGGLLGVGGGRGYLVNVAAADTDLVFGVLCEEWGLLIALTAVLAIVFFVFYAVMLISYSKSAFYAIAACGAATVFLIQLTLNVLGSVDILPLTGVTIPFISNGGSSMIASWGLLALIKSAE
ncbi:MAG: FtsW/RodA/SpoVE family cell cycle protein [Firmicutes bacterium]|nr:FtsW/RodA/SpoVE family cell cycle protein [Bacillota bacterium]